MLHNIIQPYQCHSGVFSSILCRFTCSPLILWVLYYFHACKLGIHLHFRGGNTDFFKISVCDSLQASASHHIIQQLSVTMQKELRALVETWRLGDDSQILYPCNKTISLFSFLDTDTGCIWRSEESRRFHADRSHIIEFGE